MSNDIIDDNIKIICNAFKVDDIEMVKCFMNSVFVQHILNDNNSYDRNRFIEGCIKETNMIVAKMIINSIYITEIKESVIEYIIILYFKYNKYETALNMTSDYSCDISSIFQQMQIMMINNDILINLFTKYYDVICASGESHKNIMMLIGKHNNIELLHHIEKYYKLIDTDIESILIGSVDNQYCFNIVKNMFENYNFDYNTNFMYDIIKKLYYMHYDEICDYIFNKLMDKFKDIAINDIIYYLNYDTDKLFSEYMIGFIISTFNLDNPFNDYINLFSLIETKPVFDSVIFVSNLSYEYQVIIKNILGPKKTVFHWI
jgi:hypothetical protein